MADQQLFKKLVAFKGVTGIEAHIGTQGEPTLYQDLLPLVRDLSEIPEVTDIVTDTNGTLLTPEKIDLQDSKLRIFNIVRHIILGRI